MLTLRGFFDLPKLEQKLQELQIQTESENFWTNQENAKAILKAKARLEEKINSYKNLKNILDEAITAKDLASAGDSEFLEESLNQTLKLEKELDNEELLAKMQGEHDDTSAIVEFNSGSGGTEAQDWAEMLLRMYLRWAERRGFKAEILDTLAGEEAGIKSATVLISGKYAYGFLKAEQGVHRLVRISPFDSNAKRHTSFASISVTPDIEEDIEIEISEVDLRIDTYRSSGAGGQHVNKTDSAVRLTHIPTGVVVACQNERSQHKNKAMALKMLKAKLYEMMQEEQAEKIENLKGERKKIDFGSQIRSYVLHPYQMVKDLRTNFETSDTQGVLDGKIDGFIEAYLSQIKN